MIRVRTPIDFEGAGKKPTPLRMKEPFEVVFFEQVVPFCGQSCLFLSRYPIFRPRFRFHPLLRSHIVRGDPFGILSPTPY